MGPASNLAIVRKNCIPNYDHSSYVSILGEILPQGLGFSGLLLLKTNLGVHLNDAVSK